MRDLDDQLVTILRHDGRASYAELAAQLHVPRALAAARVRALLEAGTIRVTASLHPELLGQRALAHVSVHVDGPADGAFAGLIADPAVVFVSAIAGDCDIVAEVRTGDQRDLYARVAAIRTLPHVTRVETVQYVDVPFGILIPSRPSPGTHLDQVDLHAVGMLAGNGRMTYAELGLALGISAPAARKRVVRLLDEGVLKIGATQSRRGQSGPVATGVGLNLDTADPALIVARLRRIPGIEFVATTLGRFDIIATISVAGESTLAERLDRVRQMPGVTRMESWVHLQVLKESYELLPQPTL